MCAVVLNYEKQTSAARYMNKRTRAILHGDQAQHGGLPERKARCACTPPRKYQALFAHVEGDFEGERARVTVPCRHFTPDT